MAGKHEIIVELVRMLMTQKGARVFKNAMGTGFVGQVINEYDDSVGHVIVLRNARRITFGVQNPGGSDLIGWRSVKITPEMVGQDVAQFVAVECKTPEYNKASPKQKLFLAAVVRNGGAAMIARRMGEDGIEFEDIHP